MKDILIAMTNGFIPAGEVHLIETEFLAEWPEEKRKRASSYAAPLYRLQRHAEEVQKIMDQRYLCWAYFGSEAERLFDRVARVLADVRIAAQMLLDYDSSHPADDSTRALYEGFRYKIWMGSVDTHPLHVETLAIVADATAFFGKELRRR